jgi:hypothetical protein
MCYEPQMEGLSVNHMVHAVEAIDAQSVVKDLASVHPHVKQVLLADACRHL